MTSSGTLLSKQLHNGGERLGIPDSHVADPPSRTRAEKLIGDLGVRPDGQEWRLERVLGRQSRDPRRQIRGGFPTTIGDFDVLDEGIQLQRLPAIAGLCAWGRGSSGRLRRSRDG
jgi:hypothetical protein